MEAEWTLGEFFPSRLNPFYVNDTVAYLVDDSLTKEEVEKAWYLRRDEEIRVDIPEGADIVYVKQDTRSNEWRVSSDEKNLTRNLPTGQAGSWHVTRNCLKNYQWLENDKWIINSEILKKVIKDEKWNYYRIVKMEYDFLMKYWLPLPELHRLERIKLGFTFK